MNVFTVWNLAILGGTFLVFLTTGMRQTRFEFGIGLAWGALAAWFLFILLAAVGQTIGAPIG